MTENRVGFLCNLASNMSPNNETFKLLRSYYLMRCKDLTKGYGLPPKHFSTEARCPRCCTEWTEAEVKVHPLKLSKRLRQKIRSQKKEKLNNQLETKNSPLRYNEMELICSLCKQKTKRKLIKPKKEYVKTKTTTVEPNILKESNQKKKKKKTKKAEIKKSLTITKQEVTKDAVINVYSKAYDVFSLKNEKNTISSSNKEPSKVIKNNKRKKDKFAGLCQKAVLSSVKLKQQKETLTQAQTTQNKLNLFLKPSSG